MSLLDILRRNPQEKKRMLKRKNKMIEEAQYYSQRRHEALEQSLRPRKINTRRLI